MNLSLKYSQFIPAIIIAGFSSMMSQIILLRELVIIFLGNELTLGVMLGIWLLGTALGSGPIGRFVKNLKKPINYFIVVQFVLAFLLPITIIFIRSSSSLLGRTQGELIGLMPIIFIPLATLLPICILTGFLYTLGCHIYNLITKETSTAISKVYLFEAIGSGVASFVISIILIRFLETFQLAFVICIANVLAAVTLLYFQTNKSKIIVIFILPLFIISAIYLFPYIDRLSLKKLWQNFELLHTETTIYGNIAITKFGESISFFENGFLMFTYPDLLYAEEAVQFALLEHPDPKNVLLIGGGVSGSLHQILLHPHISHVDYVELDPKIIELSEKYLSEQETSYLNDPRVHIWHKDGRLFVKQTSRKYDVIIINLPDPQTTLINRFYTLEFFQQVKKILTDNGLIGFSVTSSENVIGQELANFLTCLYNTMLRVFREVVLIPGDTNHFIGCIKSNVLTKDPNLLVQRLIQRNLNTIYLREYYIPYRMSTDRMNYLYERVTKNSKAEINLDFKPIGNFYNIVVWTTYFNQQIKSVFLFLNKIDFLTISIFSLILIVPFLLNLIYKNGREKNFRFGIITSIAIVGFSEISLEVIIILGFQAIYGYVYFQLALILSSFMIGLASGSYIAIYILKRARRIFSQFKTFQFLMALYPLILVTILKNSFHFSGNVIVFQLIFLMLTLIAGFIAGYQYPLASHLYCKINPNVERVAGTIYSADLSGACIGAFATSALLLPILGIVQTCITLSIINLVVFTGLLLANEKS